MLIVMIPVNVITAILRVLLILVTAATAAPTVSASGDHHMHIHSENGAEVWAAMCATMPGACGDDEQAPAAASTGEDAVRVLDEAGLDKGAILSLGYFYGVPELAGGKFDDHRYVRAENEYVAEQVALLPDRLVGFFSVNPLADYALDEVIYWANNGGLAGLKLHLANSDFEFGNTEHIEKLRRIIGVMNDHELPVVIHLRNRDPKYGYQDAALFIEQIAKHAPAVTFQLAHMVGWGGYDPGTDGAIQAFLDAIKNGDLDRSKVWFDLAAVVDTQMTDEVMSDMQRRFREIGFDRLLFASDWDEIEPRSYLAALKEHLSLSEKEWDQLISNEAPYLDR